MKVEQSRMKQANIDVYAGSLISQHGPMAAAIAGRRAKSCQEAKNPTEAENWNRIEAAINELRGPAES